MSIEPAAVSILSELKSIMSSTWWQRHKKTLLVIAAILIAFGGGYGTALKTGPAKVVTKTEIQTKIQDHTVYKDRIVTKIVTLTVKEKAQHVETTTTKTPDGTVVTKVISDTKTDTKVDSNLGKTDDKDKDSAKIVLVDEKTKKTVTSAQAGWRVSAGLGISIPVIFTGDHQMGVPGLKGLVVDAGVDRKLFGPLWFGLHGNTQGVLGLQLSGEF